MPLPGHRSGLEEVFIKTAALRRTMMSLRWNELRSLYAELIVGCTRGVVADAAEGIGASELAAHPFIFCRFL